MSKSSRRASAASFNPVLDRFLRAFSPARRECARIEQLVSLAADGLASESDRQDIAAHQASCAECHSLQAITEMARIDLRERPAAQPPDGFSGRLIAALDQERQRERMRERRRAPITAPQLGWAGGALAAATVIAVVMHTHVAPPSHIVAHNHSSFPSVVATNPKPAAHSGIVTHRIHTATSTGERPIVVAALPKTHPAAPAFHKTASASATFTPHHAAGHPIVLASLPKEAQHSSTPHLATPKHSASPANNAAQPPATIATLPKHLEPAPLPAHTAPPAPTVPDHTAPVVVASVPPATSGSGSVNVADLHVGDSHSHLVGTLRQLARQTQLRGSTTVATVSLASMTRRPDYTSTVSMVSSSFR